MTPMKNGTLLTFALAVCAAGAVGWLFGLRGNVVVVPEPALVIADSSSGAGGVDPGAPSPETADPAASTRPPTEETTTATDDDLGTACDMLDVVTWKAAWLAQQDAGEVAAILTAELRRHGYAVAWDAEHETWHPQPFEQGGGE